MALPFHYVYVYCCGNWDKFSIYLFSSCSFTRKKLCNDSFSLLGYSWRTAFGSQSTSSSDVKLFAFTAAELRAKWRYRIYNLFLSIWFIILKLEMTASYLFDHSEYNFCTWGSQNHRIVWKWAGKLETKGMHTGYWKVEALNKYNVLIIGMWLVRDCDPVCECDL